MEKKHWIYYNAVKRGEKPGMQEAKPMSGFYRVYAGQENGRKKYVPLGIWPADLNDQSDDPKLIIEHDGKRIDFEIERVRVCRLWVSACREWTTREAYVSFLSTGKWPTDVDEPKAAAAKVEPETMEFEATTIVVGSEIVGGEDSPEGTQTAALAPRQPASSPPTVGHNSRASGDPNAQLRDDILEDSATVDEFYQKHSVSTKHEADIAEDRRKRLSDSAKEANNKRREEKMPLEKQLADIDAKWNPVINAAQNAAALAKAKADTWVAAETARLRKEAEDRAREAARVAAEAARKAHEEALERQRLAKAAEPPQNPKTPNI
jgi:hypothetical protein